ncbi:MAG: hypothetical protein KGZ93_00145 [Actinobacteria bacterium]|nr:hypothetical protein [Actinomycetota bacterium]
MVKVQMLGKFAILTQDGEVTIPAGKVRQLAAYVFWKQGEWVRRDALRGMFWGDVDEQRAAGSLRTALHHLRQALNKGGAPQDVLEIHRDAVRVPLKRDFSSDASIFEARAMEEVHGDTPDIKSLVAAAGIYRGDFLEDMNEDWCLAERRRLSDIHAGVLRELVQRLAVSGLNQVAVSYAHRWLAIDPLDERAHRSLMRLYAAIDQPTRIAEQFESCRQILDVELGIPPSEKTISLYKKIGPDLNDYSTRSTGGSRHNELHRQELKSHKTERLSDDPLRNASFLLVYGEDKALQGDIDEGMKALEKALSIYKRHGDRKGEAQTRLIISGALLFTPVEPKPGKALAYIEPALVYYREGEQPSDLCRALLLAADANWQVGRFGRAATLAHEGMGLAQAFSDRGSEARLSLILGLALRDQHRLQEAKAAFDKAIQSLTYFTDAQDIQRVIFERALLAHLMGERLVAERFLRETLAIIGKVTPSPKVEQLEFVARANLSFTLYLMNERDEAVALCPPPEAGKYSPGHLGLLTSLVLADSNPGASVKVLEEWLRGNISQLPSYYVEPTIVVMVWQLHGFGMAKEAARWAAVGIRFARAKGWPRWTSPFYSYRALALARMGRLEAASICIRRAEENADEACYSTPAWVAWANGLVSKARGDIDSATRYLKQSIDLFNHMNDRFRARQVEIDLRELPATTLIT